jgi:hypothetical protein
MQVRFTLRYLEVLQEAKKRSYDKIVQRILQNGTPAVSEGASILPWANDVRQEDFDLKKKLEI